MDSLYTSRRGMAGICVVDAVRPINHRPETRIAWPDMDAEP